MENASHTSEEGSRQGLGSLFKKYILRQTPTNLRTELEEIIQEHEDSGDSEANDTTILRNVLQFDEVKVSDVMTQRLDIDAVPMDIELEELKKFVVDSEHTRIPVYKDNLDQLAGFLHIRDLIRFWVENGGFSLEGMVRDLIYVPPTMRVVDLLERMKLERTHMAIVVDEYGGTYGLVSIEDLMEELVGEIEDEYDEEQELEVKKIASGVYQMPARYEVSALEEELGIDIYQEGDAEDFDTLGGLIFTKMGKVPEIGESLTLDNGLIFEVVEADNRKIETVKVIGVK